MHFFLPGILIGTGIAPEFGMQKNFDYAGNAIFFALCGLIAMQAGSAYVNNGNLYFRQNPSQKINAEIKWRASRVLPVILVLLVVGWAIRFYTISVNAYLQIERTTQGELEGAFYAAIRMLELFPFQALCILSIMCWRPGVKSSRQWLWGVNFLVAAEIIYWLPSGRKEPVILAIILPLLVRYLRTSQLPSLRFVVAFIGSVVLLFSWGFAYRYALDVSGATSNASDMIRAITAANEGGYDHRLSTFEITVGRFSLVEPLSACLRIIDERVWEPFMGTSYAQALLGVIPRFLWPDKPDLHYGNEFGYMAGFIGSYDERTSISVTFFGESYLNFGWFGILPLALIGSFFGVIYRLANSSRRRETWLLLYLVTLPVILYVGGTFALYFGGLIKMMPFFYIIGRFMEGNISPLRQKPVSSSKG